MLGHMGCSHAIGVLTGGFCLSRFRQGARFSRQADRQSVEGKKLGPSSLRGTLESQAGPGLWHCQDRLVPWAFPSLHARIDHHFLTGTWILQNGVQSFLKVRVNLRVDHGLVPHPL